MEQMEKDNPHKDESLIKKEILLAVIILIFIVSIIINSLTFNKFYDTKIIGNAIMENMSNMEKDMKDEMETTMEQVGQIGLISYWNFDYYASKGEVIEDSKGINNALNHNAVYTRYGKIGEAYEFDGETSYLELPKASDDFNTNKGAISFWIYPELSKANQSFGGILHYRKGGCCSDYLIMRLHQDKNKDYLELISEIENFQTLSVKINDSSIKESEWNHIVVQQNGTAVEIYINGEKQNLIGKNSGDWFADHYPATYDFKIGDKGSWADNNAPAYFKGMIDELKIWDRILTQKEIEYMAKN